MMMNFFIYNFFENSNKKRIETFGNFNYITKIIHCSILKLSIEENIIIGHIICSFSFIIYQLEIIAF